MDAAPLKDRVASYIRDPAAESFDSLALDVLRFQYRRLPPYRRLCAAAGLDGGHSADQPLRPPISDWRRFPAVPTLVFKTLELAVDPPRETFRSSGTRGGEPSVHHHAYPDLYRLAIDASFPSFCLPADTGTLPILSLVPCRDERPDSSLAFMIDHVIGRHGEESSIVAFGPRGVLVPAARSWLSARQREGRPVLVISTAFALADLLTALGRRGLHFRLAPTSVVFVTGGFKGRSRTESFDELAGRTTERLGVVPDRIVQEYGMTELTSQCYTKVLAGGDPDLFVAPHWMRIRVLDPESLEEVPDGEDGLLSVLDLANLGSAAHLITDDRACSEADGFRLLGRAGDAELRGCSLTVEELAAGAGA